VNAGKQSHVIATAATMVNAVTGPQAASAQASSAPSLTNITLASLASPSPSSQSSSQSPPQPAPSSPRSQQSPSSPATNCSNLTSNENASHTNNETSTTNSTDSNNTSFSTDAGTPAAAADTSIDDNLPVEFYSKEELKSLIIQTLVEFSDDYSNNNSRCVILCALTCYIYDEILNQRWNFRRLNEAIKRIFKDLDFREVGR
jgi:hypothetical protein